MAHEMMMLDGKEASRERRDEMRNAVESASREGIPPKSRGKALTSC